MIKRTVLATALMFNLAVPAHAGWEFTAVTKAEGEQHSEMMNSTVKAWVDGDKSRVDFQQSGNPMMGAGNYMLSKDGGKTVFMVNPQQKTYAAWDMTNMMGMASGMMNMLNMKVENPKVEKLLEEDGGKVCGLPTKHYKFRTSYTMQMTILGMTRSSSHLKEEDIWTSTKLTDAGMGLWLRKNNTKTGNPDLDKLVQAEMGKTEGFPLKTISVTTTKESSGKERTRTVTMEVTEVKQSKPDAKLFEIPAGYTETSTMAAGSGEGSQGQSGRPGQHPGPSGSSGQDNPFLKMLQNMNQGQK